MSKVDEESAKNLPNIVEEAIKIGAKAVWMQEGVINEKAAAQAREARTSGGYGQVHVEGASEAKE